MANVVNKNKFNPDNAEYLTQALSVTTAKGVFGGIYGGSKKHLFFYVR